MSVTDTGPGIAPTTSDADLRGVPADRRRRAAAGGHRARPGALEAPRRASRRADLGRERAGARQSFRLHPAAWQRRSRMAGERVLVVEDNEKNMKLFRDVLRVTGYSHPRGEHRRGGGGARARLQAPALVLMDIQLPGSTASRRSLVALRPAHCIDSGARPDRAGDAGRPRAVPRGRVRRISLEAGRCGRVAPDGRGVLQWRLRPGRILVVDDVPENVRLLEAVLVPCGYTL